MVAKTSHDRQNLRMVDISISDMPADATERLRAMAAARSQSYQQFLRDEVLAIAARSSLGARLSAMLDGLPRVAIPTDEIEAILSQARADRDG